MTTKPAVPHTPTQYISLADASRIMGYDKALAAVNAHEELMKVARGVVLNGHTRPGDCHSDDYMGMCVCGYDQAEKAIARAEGGK